MPLHPDKKEHEEQRVSSMASVKYYPNPKGGAKKEIAHKAITTLFPHEPSQIDIKQGKLGDCTLLAAISAVLALPNGTDIIKSMFVEQDDKVIVRLFDFNTPNLTPRYIQIDKSIPVDSMFHKGAAPWVLLIEKAYTAMQNKSYQDTLTEANTPSHYKLRLLTGVKDDRYPKIMTIKKIDPKWSDNFRQAQYERYGSPYLFLELMNGDANIPEKLQSAIIEDIFNGNHSKYKQFKELIKHSPISWQRFVEGKDSLYTNDIRAYLEQANHHLSTDNTEVISKVNRWLSDNRVFQSSPKSPAYSQSMLDLYQKLSDAFSNEQPIVVDSQNTKKEGIQSGHAYAVTGFERTEKTGYLYVKVKNPQHKSSSNLSLFLSLPLGRESQESVSRSGQPKLSIKTTSHSEFKMELSDFIECFPNINLNDAANSRTLDLTSTIEPNV